MGVRNKSKASSLHHLHLVDLYRDALEVMYASESLFASLSPDQISWKPDRKAWSILECFDHLLVVNEQYISRIKAALDKRETESLGYMTPYDPSWFARKFINSMQPGAGMRMKTFRTFKPQPHADDLEVTKRFLIQQKELLSLIREADSGNINDVKLSSPVSRLIRFTIGEALTMLVVHEQRHLLQAQNVQLHSRFPEFQS